MHSEKKQENRFIHNALRQVKLPLRLFSLDGFSISGLSTYLQLPELDFLVDVGECPLSAISLNHVFLSHAHGDHSRCLMRHHSLRKMMGVPNDAAYYIPESIFERAKNWIKAEALFENVPEYKFRYPDLISVSAGEKINLKYRKDLYLLPFNVSHSIPTMGCTLFRYKKKLKQQYLGLNVQEIIALKNSGKEITYDVFEPLISFMGDCKTESLTENPHVFDSEVLVTECTFLDDEDEKMANEKSHSHLNEIIRILNEVEKTAKCQTIVLTHFSMKYSERHIFSSIEKKLPEFWRDKVKVLL